MLNTDDRTRSDNDAISRARTKLSRDIKTWRRQQFDRFPSIRKHIPLVDFTTPELEQLKLPSEFTPAMRRALGLTDLATIEYELREGQAHDALSALRQVIQEYNHNLLDKNGNIHGTKEGLRSATFFKILSADKMSAVAKYRSARAALLSLGLPHNDTIWRELHDNELHGRNVSSKRQLGESSKQDPWFWAVVRPKGLSDEKEKEWSLDSEFGIPLILLAY